ncbi:MAG TPA: hypothetical protein VKA50_03185 [Gammaproteobacteria bacterium]|nr:hypothetical protein [Gammaproteobacteria bacterium]
MPASRPRAPRRAWTGALMLALAAVGGAGVAGEDRPSAELLEFLGSFTTADGHWVDPMALQSAGTAGGAAAGEIEPELTEAYGAGHDDHD